MEQAIHRAVQQARAVLAHRTKALGLRVEHRCQRHEDGSYTLLIRLLPEGVGVDVGGVDGIVVNESRAFTLAKIEQNFRETGQTVRLQYTDREKVSDERREKALREVRRREEAATNTRDRIYWKLIGRMIETNSALDQFGHEIDESGEAWSYCISVKGMLSETIRDRLPLMNINRITGRMETFIRYCEARNQVMKIDDQQKDVLTDRICKAVLFEQ